MYLRYGSYVHDLCEATVVIDREQLDTAGGQGAGYRERWRIMGTKQAASQADLITALSALEYAYFFNGLDIGIYLPNGTTLTNHYMVSSSSVTGTKVVRPVSYPKGERRRVHDIPQLRDRGGGGISHCRRRRKRSREQRSR